VLKELPAILELKVQPDLKVHKVHKVLKELDLVLSPEQ